MRSGSCTGKLIRSELLNADVSNSPLESAAIYSVLSLLAQLLTVPVLSKLDQFQCDARDDSVVTRCLEGILKCNCVPIAIYNLAFSYQTPAVI